MLERQSPTPSYHKLLNARLVKVLPLALLTILSVGHRTGWTAENRLLTTAINSITSSELQAHVDVLSDDTFEGREAGSRGGRAAAKYLVEAFRKLGMQGGGEDGGYVQSFQGRYRNLLVRVEGSDPELKKQVVVIGAHYDHVGYGTATNSYGPTGYIHNGADDNASGTAALMEIIEAFSKFSETPARTILFAFWDGEEKGLLGSKHWAANPTVPLKDVVMAVNVDMIGRLRGNKLRVFGTRSSPGLRQFVSRQNFDSGLDLDFVWEIKANSDHYSFYERRIPFLMLHTGLHNDYHRPSDDAHKLNYDGIERVSRLLMQTAYGLADRRENYAFRSKSKTESDGTRKQLEARLAQPQPRLGLAWSPGGENESELTVTRISPGLPAAQAGLRNGDVIVALDGEAIAGSQAFQRKVLASSAPIQLTVNALAKTSR